ncbi:hypothetical protein [Candidatus Enterococcus mansonii]|uniref:Uncharacterized protein n=1 Tax=Candidatus Enterococcus mansonii TaxID=1834181 RepID=A0A242CH84_9ENTE|nr:hypothetical protein [Enterococcus sp. 4G2_DIV0659]OTO09603.1 hypothetical protein A5880_000282 [Enterococcus sp. 4G2_DIV0659]
MKPELKMKTPQLVEIVEVVHVEATRGDGTEENPVRIVHQYWSKDGVLLAEKDSY